MVSETGHDEKAIGIGTRFVSRRPISVFILELRAFKTSLSITKVGIGSLKLDWVTLAEGLSNDFAL